MSSIQAFGNLGVAILFFGYWVNVFVSLYHLTRFGIGTLPKKVAVIFLMGSVLLFCMSLLLYFKLDLNSLLI